jgi:hypothetical protein
MKDDVAVIKEKYANIKILVQKVNESKEKISNSIHKSP